MANIKLVAATAALALIATAKSFALELPFNDASPRHSNPAASALLPREVSTGFAYSLNGNNFLDGILSMNLPSEALSVASTSGRSMQEGLTSAHAGASLAKKFGPFSAGAGLFVEKAITDSSSQTTTAAQAGAIFAGKKTAASAGAVFGGANPSASFGVSGSSLSFSLVFEKGSRPLLACGADLKVPRWPIISVSAGASSNRLNASIGAHTDAYFGRFSTSIFTSRSSGRKPAAQTGAKVSVALRF